MLRNFLAHGTLIISEHQCKQISGLYANLDEFYKYALYETKQTKTADQYSLTLNCFCRQFGAKEDETISHKDLICHIHDSNNMSEKIL